jgi:hypothetical protein
MRETSGKNPPLAIRNRPWAARQRNRRDPTFTINLRDCVVPLHRFLDAPSPSAPHPHDPDLSLRSQGHEFVDVLGQDPDVGMGRYAA